MDHLQEPSPKLLGKRKALNHEFHANGINGTTGVVSQAQNEMLPAAFDLIDCHGLQDTLIKSQNASKTTLRQALAAAATTAPLTSQELEHLIEAAHAVAVSKVEEMPAFPYDPVEPQFKGATKRTAEEVAVMQDVQETRQEIADAQAARQEQLEQWRQRAMALASGRLRGTQGKGSISPSGKGKQQFETVSSAAQGMVLHRVLTGAHDIFTSVSTGDLTSRELVALKAVGDTDVLLNGATPASSSLHAPHVTIGSISDPVEHTIKPLRPLAKRPKLVEFLSYGVNDTFAPSYDSMSSTLSYSASVRARKLRDKNKAAHGELLALPTAQEALSLPSEPALAAELSQLPAWRLEQTAILLRRIQSEQINRLRANPVRPVPSAGEMSTALLVEDELVELIAEASGQGAQLVPKSSALRHLHPGSKRPGFYGGLDPRSTKAVREGLLTAPPPAK